jgi:hypothetical protein
MSSLFSILSAAMNLELKVIDAATDAAGVAEPRSGGEVG